MEWKRVGRGFLGAAAMCLTLGCTTAMASTVYTKEMACPYDGTKFTVTMQGSGSSFDTTLDLMPWGPIISPWPLAVCPTNGFVFLQDKYSDDELEQLKPLVLSDEYQALRTEVPYYRAYWLTNRLGAPREKVSYLLLQATWQVRRSNPDKYATYAGELLERLPDQIADEPDKAKRTTLQMLQGELLRALGNFEDAKRHFEALASEFPPESGNALISRFQIALCEARDTSLKTGRDAIREAEKDPEIWWRRNAPVISNPAIKVGVRLHGGLSHGGRLIWAADGKRLYWDSPQNPLAIDPFDTDAMPVPMISPIPHPVRLKPGSVVVTGDTEHLMALDPTTGQRSELPRPPLPGPAFCQAEDGAPSLRGQSPTAPYVAFICYRGVSVWNYRENKVELHIPFPHSRNVRAAFTADGEHLLVAAPNGSGVELVRWSMRDGRKVAQRQMTGYDTKIVVGDDPGVVGLVHGNGLTLLDGGLSNVVGTISHKERISSAAFSPDGRHLAVAFGQPASLAVYTIEP